MGKVKFPGLLLALAGIFASFLLGLFVGRRTGGEILYIQQERPAVSQALSMETTPPVDNVPTESRGRINVNTAGVEELSQLPGRHSRRNYRQIPLKSHSETLQYGRPAY